MPPAEPRPTGTRTRTRARVHKHVLIAALIGFGFIYHGNAMVILAGVVFIAPICAVEWLIGGSILVLLWLRTRRHHRQEAVWVASACLHAKRSPVANY